MEWNNYKSYPDEGILYCTCGRIIHFLQTRSGQYTRSRMSQVDREALSDGTKLQKSWPSFLRLGIFWRVWVWWMIEERIACFCQVLIAPCFRVGHQEDLDRTRKWHCINRWSWVDGWVLLDSIKKPQNYQQLQEEIMNHCYTIYQISTTLSRLSEGKRH